MIQVTKSTKHKNWYVMIETYNNITFMINFLVVEKTFKKSSSYSSRNNSENIYINLF